ncbi:EamA-like transporter family protein [Nitzschia inconspicua]|uniref:EamA-like transporter family protein n=1 Tax=Nitzschia inconspicua TaxID=303405 RepID=A0A9K3L2J6_9STRA|nr:EamA-like transporter family protein [Nitzschia inconspicua]
MSRSVPLVVVVFFLLQNGGTAFHVPLPSSSRPFIIRHQCDPSTSGSCSYGSRHSKSRRRATTKDYASTNSRYLLSNFTAATHETQDSSYAQLLQTFLDDFAGHDPLRDLQDFNNRGMQAPSSSNGSTMTASLAVPTIAEGENPKAAQLMSSSYTEETRDEGDLWRARLLLVSAAALYGTNFSLVKILGDTMPVGISTTLRFGLAALATLPWLIDSKILTSENARTAAWLGLEVGMWNSIGYVAQAVGLETTLASKSAFICSMAVVIVPLLEFMTGKKLLARQWVGALMALVGVAFLELGGGNGIGDAISSLTTGDALSMVQPLMFGIGFWKMEKAMHQCPEEARRLTAAQLMAVFLGSATYGLYSMSDVAHAADASVSMTTFVNAYPWKEWLTDPSILFSLFWTGCITTALTIYMETMALETLSAAETTLIFSTEPLWGTAFAAAVMGEQLGMNAAVGAFFILVACLYSNLGVQGLEHTWRSGISWLRTIHFKSNRNIQPLWRSLPERLSWMSSSLATSLATWNVATSNLNPQELNDIVDDLLEKLS